MIDAERTTQTEPLVETQPLTAVQRLLLDAADLLERTGWCQRYGTHPVTGAHCVLGALSSVGGEGFRDALILFSGLINGDDPSPKGITQWNDQRGRTADEVIARLRQTALEAH